MGHHKSNKFDFYCIASNAPAALSKPQLFKFYKKITTNIISHCI